MERVDKFKVRGPFRWIAEDHEAYSLGIAITKIVTASQQHEQGQQRDIPDMNPDHL
jgi:hypothetical protein